MSIKTASNGGDAMRAEIWRLVQWWWRNLDERKPEKDKTFGEHAIEYVMAALIVAFVLCVINPIGLFLHAKFFPRPTPGLTAEAAPGPTPVTQYAAPFPRPADTPSPTPHHRKHHHATEPG
jgi:hypothetical protein